MEPPRWGKRVGGVEHGGAGPCGLQLLDGLVDRSPGPARHGDQPDTATNVPIASFGIGGSPGESVFVKGGASTVEPLTEEDRNRYLRMNIDKGNQANGGEDMVVLGNVAHGEVVNREYRIKTLDNMDQPLSVSTDGEGRVWLIVGTDSGFEGLSALYYARISYTLSILEPPKTGGFQPPVWAVVLVAGIGVALAGLGLMAMRLRTRR